MHVAPSPEDRSRCPVCRAALAADSLSCAGCGARLVGTPVVELRGIIYLLSELKDWEARGLIGLEQAEALRRRYESRRDELRAQLSANGEQLKSSASPVSETLPADAVAPKASPPASVIAEKKRSIPTPAGEQPAQSSIASVLSKSLRFISAKTIFRPASTRESRRPFFETLADPYTLRLLLYTGAAMLVVGIVIWLRDVLYLKLQEPLIQAVLLALGTVAVTVFGWLATLRTRLRLTGRALTLIGSLLVPVNFWFLVRSGLISNHGRAWMVCALCATLYAYTAALLRERLYVYLSCVSGIATAWSLIYRASPEAYGLYALSLMTASLVFLHLSRVFPTSTREDGKAEAATNAAEDARGNSERQRTAEALRATEPSRRSYELWGAPLVRVALFGATFGALLYMLLRVGPAPSLYDGAFRWRASEYDAGVAMLLFGAGAYVAWFTARFIYTDRRAVFYTTSALALFWMEFLLLDGLQVSGQTHLLALSATALTTAFAARLTPERILAEALHRASAIVLTLLFLTAGIVALLFHLAANELDAAWRPAMFFALSATVLFGVLRGWRNNARSLYGAGLAAAAALVLVAAALDALKAVPVFPPSWPIAAGVICAAFLLQRASLRWLPAKDAAVVGSTRVRVLGDGSPGALIRVVMDGGVIVCALLWFARTFSLTDENGWSAACVLLLATLYWIERTARLRFAPFVHVSSLHAGAFLLALLFALRVERRFLAAVFALVLFPVLFALSRYARAREAIWLARPAREAAAILAASISLAIVFEAAPVLQTGNELLLAPAMTAGALCLVTLAASLFTEGRERVGYFRVALTAAVSAFALAILRAGYDPVADVEMYTSPVAVVLLIVSYLAMRREWDDYARDTNLLVWTGSLLLCGPLLIRALQFRLLLDLPAQWRDMGVLCVSLLVILFGVGGRLRAPVIVGMVTLVLELATLALTSVEWLQVPLKVYLITAGAMIMVIWGVFEYRREQLLLMRQRLHERGTEVRERFNSWR